MTARKANLITIFFLGILMVLLASSLPWIIAWAAGWNGERSAVMRIVAMASLVSGLVTTLGILTILTSKEN